MSTLTFDLKATCRICGTVPTAWLWTGRVGQCCQRWQGYMYLDRVFRVALDPITASETDVEVLVSEVLSRRGIDLGEDDAAAVTFLERHAAPPHPKTYLDSPSSFVRVVLESPFAGDRERNDRYLAAAMADSLSRGEAPFASHGLYTQPGVLNDDDPDERERGICAGFAWREVADKTVVYLDLGMSSGMQRGVDHALRMGQLVEYRHLPGWT